RRGSGLRRSRLARRRTPARLLPPPTRAGRGALPHARPLPREVRHAAADGRLSEGRAWVLDAPGLSRAPASRASLGDGRPGHRRARGRAVTRLLTEEQLA